MQEKKEEFSKTLCKIAIPVALQCMLQSSFSIVDQLMIGHLGKASVSAVGLAGNFSLIYSVVMGAVGTVAGILIAQFLGAKDQKEAWRSFHVSWIFGLLVSLLFTLGAVLLPEPILRLYTEDSSIIREGLRYFKVVGWAYLPMGLSTILATWLRCREHASLPMAASFCSVLVNTVFNYILIFGKGGAPTLGIQGAAYASLLAEILNLLLIAGGFLLTLKKEKEKILWSFSMRKVSLKQYFLMMGPILLSEFLWSLGQNVESGVYGHLGTDSLAAYTLTTPIQGLFCGGLSGLSAAAGVMVGKRLGAGEEEEAYADSKKIMWYGLGGALLASLLLILLSGFYVSLYDLEEEIRWTGQMLLVVFAIYAPVKVENMILTGGIMKSGGDTRTVMCIDIFGTWCLGIPLCFWAAFILKLQIVGVYSIFTLEEVARLILSLFFFRRKKWMMNLTKCQKE